MTRHLGIHVTDTDVALALAEISGAHATLLWTASLPRHDDQLDALIRTLLRDCPTPRAAITIAPPAHRAITFSLQLPQNAKHVDIAQTVTLQATRLATDIPVDAQRTSFAHVNGHWLAGVCDTSDLTPLSQALTAHGITHISCDIPVLAWQRLLPALDDPDAIVDLTSPTPTLYLFPHDAAPRTHPLQSGNLPRTLWRQLNDARQQDVIHVQHLAVFGSLDAVERLTADLSQYEGLCLTTARLPDQAPTATFAAALATWPASPRFDFLATPRRVTLAAFKPLLPHTLSALAIVAAYVLFLTAHLYALNTATTRTNTAIAALTPRLLTTQTLMRSVEALQHADASATIVRAKNTSLLLTVAQLGAAISKHAWLSTLQQTATGWMLAGHALRLPDEAATLDHLARAALPLTPALTTASGSPTTSFAWSATLDPATPPPPIAGTPQQPERLP